jgi:antitoxin component of MazEF toxin-antitoxin module
VKLQKQLSRKVKDRKYPKYVMTIPPDYVEKLGWKQGAELEVHIKDKKLIVQAKQESENEREQNH